jgi:hypothetical protein
MRKALLAVAALLALGACAPRDYNRDGASPEQQANDEQLCRQQVRKMVATERNVEDSRRDTFRSEQARYGQTALPDTMASQGSVARENRLMESCMSARGYAPKAQWWQKLGS